MGDGLQTSQRARHGFDDIPRGGKASASLGKDDLAVNLHLEAAGMAADENGFYAQRLMQGLDRGVGLGQVVAGDAIKNGNHRSSGALAAGGL
jgi:hypothetical protein